MLDHRLLRLSAMLVIVGDVLVTVVVLFLHPGGGPTLKATFADDAASGDWTAIHLAQFAGVAFVLGGLLALVFALDIPGGPPRWLGLFGAVSAVVALALAGVVFAVDGVANKQAVDAWVSAPAAEKPTRFAVAEALRWVEIGTSSYLDIMWGLALVFLAVAIVWTAIVPRPIGYLMGLSGSAFVLVGWLVGMKGFTSLNGVPTDAAYGFLLASMIWLLVVGSGTRDPVPAGAPMYSGRR
jgi:hypothetical protein